MIRTRFGRASRMLAGVLVAAAFASTVAASRAAFHTTVVKSEPRTGDSVKVAPKIIKLWFSEPPKTGTLEVKLATAAGSAVKLGPVKPDTTVKGDNPPLMVDVQGPMAPGTYRVNWNAIAPDGDASKGNFSFKLLPSKP